MAYRPTRTYYSSEFPGCPGTGGDNYKKRQAAKAKQNNPVKAEKERGADLLHKRRLRCLCKLQNYL